MKLTLNIEADSPEEMAGVLAALGGANLQPAAAKATRTKAEKPAEPTPAAPSTPPSAEPVAAAPSPTATAAAPAATPAVADAPVTEADIVAAANAAAGKLGAAGPAKIRDFIKANFKKADGTEGTLKTTAPDQQPRLLACLQQIARGELTL